MEKVIYIAGYGRSGSTILDMLLGSNPSIIGVGEVINIFDFYNSGSLCSCGVTSQACSFWSVVMGGFHSVVPQFSTKEILRVTRIVESGLSMVGMPSSSVAAFANYALIWGNLFQSIFRISSTSILVDSSKTTGLTYFRPLALAKACGFEVNVIHLVRDPRAVLWSLMRGSNRNLEAGKLPGKGARKVGAIYRGLSNWYLSNLSVHLFQRLYEIPLIRIRYEDLVSNPHVQLERIEKAFAVDLRTSKEIVETNATIPAGHGVAGNRLRRTGTQHLQLNEDWKAHLPVAARLLAVSSLPLASRYGYRVGRLFS